MRTIIFCVFAILALAATPGCQKKSPATEITTVLNACAGISQRAAALNNSPGPQATFIAAEFQKMNVSSCPADFRMAFQAHILAWQLAAPYFANVTNLNAFLEGVYAGLTNDVRVIGEGERQALAAANQINSTYAQLTMIAAKYGATIPRSVVGETR